MTKIVQTDFDSYYFGYPSSAAIITCASKDRRNAMALAWHTTFSRDPLRYGALIFPQNYSHELILESKEFVINFMPAESAGLIAQVGGSTGSQIDKFNEFRISTEQASVVNAPVLKAAYAAYECTLVDYRNYGDHDLFVGQVVAVQWEESVFQGDGTVDLTKISPAMYIGEDQYAGVSGTIHHLRN